MQAADGWGTHAAASPGGTPPATVCASLTPSDLTSNLAQWKQCGCSLPSLLYLQELGGVCGALCGPPAVLSNPEVAGCGEGEGTCYFDDTTVAWLNLGGGTSLVDACRWMPNRWGATCVFDEDAVGRVQAALSKASGGHSTVADTCGTCFTVGHGIPGGGGERTPVDCTTFQPLPPSSGVARGWTAHMWVFLAAGGGVLLLLLLFLLLHRHRQNQTQAPPMARMSAARRPLAPPLPSSLPSPPPPPRPSP